MASRNERTINNFVYPVANITCWSNTHTHTLECSHACSPHTRYETFYEKRTDPRVSHFLLAVRRRFGLVFSVLCVTTCFTFNLIMTGVLVLRIIFISATTSLWFAYPAARLTNWNDRRKGGLLLLFFFIRKYFVYPRVFRIPWIYPPDKLRRFVVDVKSLVLDDFGNSHVVRVRLSLLITGGKRRFSYDVLSNI